MKERLAASGAAASRVLPGRARDGRASSWHVPGARRAQPFEARPLCSIAGNHHYHQFQMSKPLKLALVLGGLVLIVGVTEVMVVPLFTVRVGRPSEPLGPTLRRTGLPSGPYRPPNAISGPSVGSSTVFNGARRVPVAHGWARQSRARHRWATKVRQDSRGLGRRG